MKIGLPKEFFEKAMPAFVEKSIQDAIETYKQFREPKLLKCH
jgi:hypothetical protein